MAYDDGYYYGQCKIVAVVDNTADNGKTVLITTDDNKTYSGTIANKKCEFLLPPRTLYTVQKVSSGSTEFTTKVEAGYGDCILVHLDTGYVEVKQGDIVGLDYIKAATDNNLKNKVPEAKAVKELNNSLGGIKFGIDSDGNYGYIKAGADTVTPFSNNQSPFTTSRFYCGCQSRGEWHQLDAGTLKITKDCKLRFYVSVTAGYGFGRVYYGSTYTQIDSGKSIELSFAKDAVVKLYGYLGWQGQNNQMYFDVTPV